MTSVANLKTEPSKPVDWTNVRPVYQKLNTDFHVLTGPFGITISPSLNNDLGHLIAAIDVIDRYLDPIESESGREKFSNAMFEFLSGVNDFEPAWLVDFDLSEEFLDRAMTLRNIICRLGIQAEFCRVSKKVVDYTEAKRQSKTQTGMIENLVAEWECTGHLPVLFLTDQSTPEFERFFLLACSMMPAIDMIQDARMDFREGNISVRPTLWLYVRLLAIFLLPLPKLMWRFPAKWNLIKYAISFLRV